MISTPTGVRGALGTNVADSHGDSHEVVTLGGKNRGLFDCKAPSHEQENISCTHRLGLAVERPRHGL